MMLCTGFALLSGTAAVFLSLIFAQSVAAKMAEMDAFIASIDAYQLIPPAAGGIAARGVVAAEILAIVAILTPVGRPCGALLGITLLLGYAVAMTTNLLRGRQHIDCGCGGPRQSISYTLVLRNVFLAAIGVFVLTVRAISLAINEVFLVGASGITLWLGWTVVEQLQANFTHVRRGREGQA
jgi:uncharacterized membrane protein YphA (DoxX/SURF4 family)